MSENEQAPPAPVIVGEPVEIANGVFVIPDGRVPLVPNVGIVVGEERALVIDTGMGPRNGETVLRHARALAGDRPLLLTLTHFHPEHAFGAQVFEDCATIVYNAAQRDELRLKGPGYLEMFRTFGEGIAAQLVGVALVDPHVAYEADAEELDLGGRVVRLLTWGLAHTLADQVVHLPDAGVIFGGDLFETRMFPIVPYFPPDDTDVDLRRWAAVLDDVLLLDPSLVVPGHGEVTDAGLVRDVRSYLLRLADDAADAKRNGLTVDEAVAKLEPEILERHPDWDNPEWIGFGVRCAYDAASRTD